MLYNFLLGAETIHSIDRTDLSKISNLVLGWEVIVMDLYSSLEWQREWESERRPVGREEIVLVTTQEQRYISEPTETKYLKFWMLNLLGSGGI
jgi:hypothetical protein